jgi:hypothetical protein
VTQFADARVELLRPPSSDLAFWSTCPIGLERHRADRLRKKGASELAPGTKDLRCVDLYSACMMWGMSDEITEDQGTLRIDSVGTDWHDSDRTVFETALRDLGVSGDRLADDLEFFDEQHRLDVAALRSALRSAHRLAFHGIDGPNNHVREHTNRRRIQRSTAFADWLARRQYVVHDEKVEIVQVPVFQLHCPGIEGCKVKYSEASSGKDAMGWKLTVAGTGLGATRTVTAKYVAKFVAEPGQCKVIFVPVPITVYSIWVFEKDGTFVSEGLRTEVNAQQSHVSFAQALRSAPEHLCNDAASSAAEGVEVFSLQDDLTGATSVYEREWSQEATVKVAVGIDGFGLKTEIAAQVKTTRTLKLTYELVGGYSYEALKPTSIPGLAWRTPV